MLVLKNGIKRYIPDSVLQEISFYDCRLRGTLRETARTFARTTGGNHMSQFASSSTSFKRFFR